MPSAGAGRHEQLWGDQDYLRDEQYASPVKPRRPSPPPPALSGRDAVALA